MIEDPLAALTKAWITTVVAASLLLIALATAQISAVYLRSLPLATEGPPPIIDDWG